MLSSHSELAVMAGTSTMEMLEREIFDDKPEIVNS